MRAQSNFIHNILNQPSKVFWACLVLGGLSVLFNGNLLRLYKLHRDRDAILQQIVHMKAQIADLDKQIYMAKDPTFIERQALDLYDLAQEHDLVFVFSEE